MIKDDLVEFERGTYISIPVYGKVLEDNPGNILIDSPNFGGIIECSKVIITTSGYLSNYQEESKKVNKHVLAEKLMFSNGKVFVATFEKKTKDKDGKPEVRTLIGFLTSVDDRLGLSHVVDLEKYTETKDISKSKRMIYHHALKSIVINGVKYHT